MVTSPAAAKLSELSAPPYRSGGVRVDRSPQRRPAPRWARFVLILIAALALREVASLILPPILGLLIALVAWPMVGA